LELGNLHALGLDVQNLSGTPALAVCDARLQGKFSSAFLNRKKVKNGS
jgi:hypothetical protein